jgi:hypothetical protein
MLTITPVLEVPWKKEGYEWPWAVLPDLPYASVPLDPASLECMGTFYAALVAGESPDSVESCLQMIRDADELSAYGGFEISDEVVQIRPSCCSGIEHWREWRNFLETGASPWMGHDPFGWAERKENEIIIWTDGAATAPHARTSPSIATSCKVFESALSQAEGRLKSFISGLPRWLNHVGHGDAKDILRKIEHDFKTST